ncbi:hypothetical protein QTP70_030952 [Hemibagrus guttatus]|uniref:Uncharacterized protein n=1 Tax=Hemibagrus guttatus TaxID=175788 RepID=A0AAE0UJK5_9TELE|nr:hypothetical protein QTP70_030952 [Hemibagrus guttatus]
MYCAVELQQDQKWEMCEQATEPALVQSTEVHQDQMTVHEQEQDAHRILQVENDKMKKTLNHEEEIMKDCVRDWEELLKVSVVKAVKKHRKARKTITWLEKEKSEVKVMEAQLSETHLQYDELMNVSVGARVEGSQHHEMKNTLNHQDQLLKRDEQPHGSVES